MLNIYNTLIPEVKMTYRNVCCSSWCNLLHTRRSTNSLGQVLWERWVKAPMKTQREQSCKPWMLHETNDVWAGPQREQQEWKETLSKFTGAGNGTCLFMVGGRKGSLRGTKASLNSGKRQCGERWNQKLEQQGASLVSSGRGLPSKNVIHVGKQVRAASGKGED